jgi:hypothetical protein
VKPDRFDPAVCTGDPATAGGGNRIMRTANSIVGL